MIKKMKNFKFIRPSVLTAFVFIQPVPDVILLQGNSLNKQAQSQQKFRSITKENFAFEKFVPSQFDKDKKKAKRKAEKIVEEVLNRLFPVGTTVEEFKQFVQSLKSNPVARENTEDHVKRKELLLGKLEKRKTSKNKKRVGKYTGSANRPICRIYSKRTLGCDYLHSMTKTEVKKLTDSAVKQLQREGQSKDQAKTISAFAPFLFSYQWMINTDIDDDKIGKIKIKIFYRPFL